MNTSSGQNKPDRAGAIFSEALGLPEDERQEFIDSECLDDELLSNDVNSLLRAHAVAPDGFLSSPVTTIQSSGDLNTVFTQKKTGARSLRRTNGSALESEGDEIGPYKLLQQIGEGGFGVVWMAEQSEPIKRKVALKVIKAGMDTREVLARFEAERQALAMMDHPNIARVLDAGATSTGRPYFAMELVKGIPITQFCDESGMDINGRLDLFGDVCSAINHAHQKGVIHRDIKPSNILLDEEDEPFIVDFGLAIRQLPPD